MKVLIATSKWPKSKENFTQLCEILRAEATNSGLSIERGILWTAGPGCSNLAFKLTGDEDESERFANQITMAMMPSKWTTTGDELPEEDTWNM